MIPRLLKTRLSSISKQFPAITVFGPRQSGKTTLVRNVFPKKPYVSLENPDLQDFALQDPRGFLAEYPNGAILDEVQRVPELLSYLQEILDKRSVNGLFILTGSHNYLLQEKVSQSLAGRTAILTLLPFSVKELKSVERQKGTLKLNECVLYGGYPKVALKEQDRQEWFASYIRTYVERDLRLIKNISDLRSFRAFLNLCAGRVGQILNLSSLALDAGISHNTAKAWISILESSYIIFLVSPYYKNFNKRIIKAPKLYFYDTGLLTYLLDIQTEKQYSHHYARGNIFECFILSEILKKQHAVQAKTSLYYFRDSLGREIDGLIEHDGRIDAIEVKASHTIRDSFFDNLHQWKSIAKEVAGNGFLIYAGDDNVRRTGMQVLSWSNVDEVI